MPQSIFDACLSPVTMAYRITLIVQFTNVIPIYGTVYGVSRFYAFGIHVYSTDTIEGLRESYTFARQNTDADSTQRNVQLTDG